MMCMVCPVKMPIVSAREKMTSRAMAVRMKGFRLFFPSRVASQV